MTKNWILMLLLLIMGCSDEELPFTPTIDSIYDNQFLVWQKTVVSVNDASGETKSTVTRDVNLQYIFTVDKALKSTDGGDIFNEYPKSYVGLDSISIAGSSGNVIESFFVLDVFRMKDGRPVDNENPRNEKFPELKGFYLFLKLEKKQKIHAEGITGTEFYLLYASGYQEN